jgi:hypothetical protein
MPEVPLPPHGAGAPVPSVAPVAPAAPLPASMEGLANQGMGLGPPNNLHDRVVFVSNVSGPRVACARRDTVMQAVSSATALS